jgi:hypothetical protein
MRLLARSVRSCRVLVALVLLSSAACGKATRAPNGAEGGADAQGGSAGSSSQAGGTGGIAAAGAVAGQSGSDGVSVALPNATPEDRTFLEPLFVDPAEIEQADLQQLIELGARIGVARGYAMCRCASPNLDLGEGRELLPCAREEAGGLRHLTHLSPNDEQPRLNADFAQCLRDESVDKPWLAEKLRCDLQWYGQDGRAWLELCSLPGFDGDSAAYPHTPLIDCPGVSETMQSEYGAVFILLCPSVTYCDDGTRVSSPRCNGTPECADWSDERNCFDIRGRDMLVCGEQLQEPWSVCELASCAEGAAPGCEPGQSLECPDGTELAQSALCDRKADCADEEDERYCFRQ